MRVVIGVETSYRQRRHYHGSTSAAAAATRLFTRSVPGTSVVAAGATRRERLCSTYESGDALGGGTLGWIAAFETDLSADLSRRVTTATDLGAVGGARVLVLSDPFREEAIPRI